MRVGLLRTLLESIPMGPIESDHFEDAVSLLANAWPELDGAGATGMNAEKITTDRVEKLSWDPPVLSFRIERHGATVNGSSRAHVYPWWVDVEDGTAAVGDPTPRQKRPNAPAFDAGQAANEVIRLVVAGAGVSDPRLTWKNGACVKVNLSVLIPDGGPAQTAQGRRKRFRAKFEPLMTQEGWRRVTIGTQFVFERVVEA